VQVLEDQQHRSPLSQPTDDAQDAFEQPRLAPFRHGRQRVPRGIGRPDTRPKLRQKADQLLAGAAHDRRKIPIG
jgi:hypothetical protein